MNTRRSGCTRLFAHLVVAVYSGALSLPQVHAEEHTTYAAMVKQAKQHWRRADQRQVHVTWNPKAPDPARLKMNVVFVWDNETLVVYSGPDEQDQDFVAYFDENGAVLVDNRMRTVASLPPFDLKDGGATTGLPSELLAARLLTLSHAVPAVTRFKLDTPHSLNAGEEQRLARFIFPDSSDPLGTTGRPATSLQRTIMDNGSKKYRWMDRGGSIFEFETSECDDKWLVRRQESFGWVSDSRKKLDVPRLSTLVDRLVRAKCVIADGSPIAFIKGRLQESAMIEDRSTVSMEMMRIRFEGKVGAISISRASPIRVKQVESRDRQDGKATIQLGVVKETADSRSLALTGQDWMVVITLPGMDAGNKEAKRVINEIQAWLESLVTTLE